MKSLLHITRLFFSFLFIISVTACKKDNNDVDAADGKKGSYTFEGKSSNTTRVDYLFTGTDTYLFVYGSDPTDIVQFIFSKLDHITPNGTYTYFAYPSLPYYSPKSNFSGGSVTSVTHPESVPITGGKITVSKDGDNYSVTFDCTTENNGAIQGTYTGTLVSR